MPLYLLRRLGIFLLTLFGASIVVFAALAILPGDPAQTILGINATPDSLHELRAQLGLDRSLPAQYADWIGGLLRGDPGLTYTSRIPIAPEIGQRIEVTGPLVLLGVAIAVVLAVPFGVLAALGHRRAWGTVISALTQVGIAIPAFWAGILLITIVSVNLHWLPAGGFTSWSDSFTGALESLVLPAVSLAIVQGAILTRYVRSAILDVMREDYMRTARAKGLTRAAALRRHGFRNASIPVVTVLGLQLSGLLVGAVVIENVFSLPGLGRMLLQSIGQRDVRLVEDIVMTLTAAVLLVNFLVDLTYHVLDPRLRSAG
jgi:peptide/nickel transport system permease protein